MEILSVFGINVLVQVVKKFIKPKFGNTGVHVFVFLIAFIGVALVSLYHNDTDWRMWITDAISYLILTIGAYELIIKQIVGVFKKKK